MNSGFNTNTHRADGLPSLVTGGRAPNAPHLTASCSSEDWKGNHMTQTKFTPGPWRWHRDDLITVSSPHKFIAKVDQEYTGLSWDEDEGNHHLIAAAPELYEALDIAETLIRGDLIGSEWKHACNAFLKQAKATLAKARGES